MVMIWMIFFIFLIFFLHTYLEGDNTAEFDDMKDSIAGVLTANIYGIPFSGCDLGMHMYINIISLF
jgi:hypothetical protein